MKAGFGFACLLLVCAGCAPKTLEMRDQARMSLSDMRAIRAAQSTCNFVVEQVRDSRKNPEAIGYLSQVTEFKQDGVLAWLESGLRVLEQRRNDSGGDVVYLNADLVKLYMDFVGASIASTVVLRVQHHTESDDVQDLIVRGTNFVGNWATGSGELQTAMDMALSDAVMQLAQSIDSCA